MATNKRRFTEAMIERLRPPKTGRIELGDEVVPGLVLRVTPNAVKSFSVIYKVPGEGGISASGRPLAGRQHRITLGQYPRLKLTKAREDARAKLEIVTQGRDPRPEMREQHLIRHTNTVDKVSERFITDIKRTVESWRNIERAFNLHILPTLGSRPIRDVRRADAHELLDKLVADGKVGVAREVRKDLQRLFNWAADREIVPINPLANMKRDDLAANEDAGRALTDDEIWAVWHGAEKMGYPAGDYYRLTLLTGCRRAEWAQGRRSEISVDDRTYEIPAHRQKSRRVHVVPLADPAWAIISALPEMADGAEDWLFPSRTGKTPMSGFSKFKATLDDKARKALGESERSATLAPFRVHDFRVTCQTRLAALGVGEEVQEAVLAHAKSGLQKIYNKHAYLEEKREALAAYGDHLMEIVR